MPLSQWPPAAAHTHHPLPLPPPSAAAARSVLGPDGDLNLERARELYLEEKEVFAERLANMTDRESCLQFLSSQLEAHFLGSWRVPFCLWLCLAAPGVLAEQAGAAH